MGRNKRDKRSIGALTCVMAKDPSQRNSCGLGAGEPHALGGGDAVPALAAPQGSAEVYVALLTANVLRLRREWALAEAKCSEVLRLDPQNATAHSLMGDILRDQGRVNDAIEWYKLALDLNPASDADRRKLEALIDQVFPERPKGARRVLRSVFGKWVKATTEEVRVPRPTCPWAVLAAAVLGVVMLGAFVAVFIARRPVPSAEPGVPPSAGAFAVETGRGDSGGVEPAVQTVMPPELTGDITALERLVFARLRQQAAATDPNCQVIGVEVDPQEAQVVVRITMPELWSPRDQRASLLRAAATMARGVALFDTRFASVKVRVTARPSLAPEQLALVANGSAETIRGAEDAGVTQHPEALFQSIWWRRSLRDTGGDSAAGER